MKIDPNVLQQLGKSFGVSPAGAIGNIQGVIQQCEKAPSKYEPVLTGNDYQWDDNANAYVKGDQKIYFYPEKGLFLWLWADSLTRLLKGTEMLTKWVQGNEKYPEGKANKFMETYLQMTGQQGAAPAAKKAPVNRMDLEEPEPDDDPISGPVPDRSGVAQPPSEADAIIKKIEAGAGIKPGTKLSQQAPIYLPANKIIDLYQQTKEMAKTDPEGSKKLLDFIKTIKPHPLKTETVVKKSSLERLIQEIVRGVVGEMGKKKSSTAEPDDDDDGGKDWQSKWKRGEYGSSADMMRDFGSKRPEDNDRKWVEDFANKMWKDPMDIGRGGPGLKWRVLKSKTAETGEVVYHLGKTKTVELSKFIIKKGDDWFYLEQDPETKAKKWVKMSEKPTSQVKMDEPIEPEEPEIDEMTTTAAVAPIATPKAFKKKEEIAEMNSTDGGTPGYNVPGAFARKGGSKAGLAGSAALGYTLTAVGQKEMQRSADKLL